uniref:tRNA (guanine(46)-N(7))-methyltransferase n=1 Tax=Aegilops tauschii subsp. strangulata TaxID=200361 RepID=A0A453CZL4_AEGTS
PSAGCRTGSAAAQAPAGIDARMAWTAAASLCCRLVRAAPVRRRARRRTLCSAARSTDAVDREYADLNLRPLYPNVRPNPTYPILPVFNLRLLFEIAYQPDHPPTNWFWCMQRGHHLRIRQHVNPLSALFVEPTEPPEWTEVFEDPLLPLMVDIGCGSGRFLVWLAKNSGERRNYLGLEIRQKVGRADTVLGDRIGA